MNKDFRVSVGFMAHPKTHKLRRKAGDIAVLNLLQLWSFVAMNRPDGNLSGLDVDDIEIAAGWAGEPGAFVDTLSALGFLDGEPGAFRVHDWMDHNDYAAKAEERSAKAKKGAEAKWAKARESKPLAGSMLGDATSNAQACSELCPSLLFSSPKSSSPLPPPAGEPAPASDEEAQEAEPEEAEEGGYLDSGDMGFHELWDAYPKKIKRGAALRAYEATKRKRPNVHALLPILAQHADSPDWRKDKGRYVPTLESWLLDERWREVPGQQAKPQPSIQAESPDQFRARIKRERETVAQSMPRPVAAAP